MVVFGTFEEFGRRRNLKVFVYFWTIFLSGKFAWPKTARRHPQAASAPSPAAKETRPRKIQRRPENPPPKTARRKS
jgi:hypothetical protein